MKSHDELMEKMKELLASQLNLDPKQIKPSSQLHGELGMDSVDTMNVLSAIKLHWNVKLGETDVANIERVEELVELIAARLPKKR